MSVDISFQDLPEGVSDPRRIPRGFVPGPIGSRAAVVAALEAAAPVDFTDPTWGHIDGPGYSIEVSLPAADPVESFAFHLRGSNDAEVDLILADVLATLGIRALDPRRGKVIVGPEDLIT